MNNWTRFTLTLDLICICKSAALFLGFDVTIKWDRNKRLHLTPSLASINKRTYMETPSLAIHSGTAEDSRANDPVTQNLVCIHCPKEAV
jgi:hypothetical protein